MLKAKKKRELPLMKAGTQEYIFFHLL